MRENVFLKKAEQGFTLLEILIVLVILAVLAGLAVPAYVSSVEKQRKQEAISMLGVVRLAEQRYFIGKSFYTADYADLDYDPTTVVGATGNTAHYTYAVPVVVGGDTYTVTATRNGVDRPIGVGAYTVTIDQDGVLTATF